MQTDAADQPDADQPDTDQPGSSDDTAGLGYEQARQQLVEVVQRLESGGAPLDESLALWERGERLAALCQRFLDGAAKRVAAARAGSEGHES